MVIDWNSSELLAEKAEAVKNEKTVVQTDITYKWLSLNDSSFEVGGGIICSDIFFA